MKNKLKLDKLISTCDYTDNFIIEDLDGNLVEKLRIDMTDDTHKSWLEELSTIRESEFKEGDYVHVFDTLEGDNFSTHEGNIISVEKMHTTYQSTFRYVIEGHENPLWEEKVFDNADDRNQWIFDYHKSREMYW